MSFLSLLLRNGVMTEEQLRRAIESFRHDPHHYAWILRLRHTTLDKADKVFFVRSGRFPTQNDDFPVNGNYYQICQTLQCNPDCLDEPRPQFFFESFGDSALELRLGVWTRKERFVELKNAMLMDIKAAFDAQGIEIPFPHRSL